MGAVPQGSGLPYRSLGLENMQGELGRQYRADL